MGLRKQLRRHRKNNLFIVGGLAVLLVLLTVGYFLLQRSRELAPQLVTNRVLLFVLWYVNVILILAILFVLLRNLFKLLVERHHRILGSKFKTKLVLTYVGLSLIPVLVLFLLSTQLVTGSVDRWFSTSLDEVLTDGNAVAQELNSRIERRNFRDARQVLEAVADLDLAEPDSRGPLDRRLRRLISDLRLDYVAIYEGTDFVNGLVDSQSRLADLPEPGRGLLREAMLSGEARSQPSTYEDGALHLAAVSSGGADGSPPVAVVGRLLDEALAASIRKVILAHQSYRQLEVQKEELKGSYLLIFLMLTLLILLATSWVGLYLARRVTVPIQALADGTRRISEGDLEHRVEVEADDELGVLVDSFNRMTDELKSNKELLEAGNEKLTATNAHLAEERARIAAVLEGVAAGVISFGSEGRVLTCNTAALEMLAQRSEEVVGRLVSEVWSDNERRKLASLVAELDSRGEGQLVREIHLVLAGEWKTYEVTVTPIGGGATSRGQVMVLEDLTELIKAQQLAAWREAARRIAHEIKNPLTPIQLSAERLLQKYRRGDEELGVALEEGVEVIVGEVQTLQTMVDEFSRYARMPRPQPAKVDVGALLAETVRLYRDLKPGVEVSAELADVEVEGWFDREQVKRALINLVDNAMEATEAPGAIRLAAAREDGHVRIDVADTGRGIPAPARDKLFLPYFSTKGRGTGLGLAIVHRIISEHHGQIRVEDNEPQGTVVRLELPVE